MERAKMAFNFAKNGRKGELSKYEYKVAMTALFGHCPDKCELKHIFEDNSEVSLSDFLRLANEKGLNEDLFISAKTLFLLLDKDFKGHLVLTDFYSAVDETHLKISKSLLKRAFHEADNDKKGFLSLDELEIMMSFKIRSHIYK